MKKYNKLPAVPFRRTMNSNFAGTNVSKLMLMAFRPASFNRGNNLAKFMPLVVTAMVCNPSSLRISAGEKQWGEKDINIKCLNVKGVQINQ